ncbi:hypothetical protein KJA14_00445 [Patescibacteria group bacterium]|nr:hypothetical protein [Patescibacteria group bacterium]
MSKIILVLALVSLLSLLLLPMVALAQIEIKECCTLHKTITVDTVTCNEDTVAAPDAAAAADCAGAYCAASADVWGMFCILNTIYRVTDWVSYILFAFVGVMIIIGAFTIVTAGGSPDKVSSGRNYIVYAIIGLVVAFFARAIPALVKAVIGM